MRLTAPLVSKFPDEVLRVILLGRVSTLTQDLESNTAQHDDSERFLKQEYTGATKIHRFGDQASGWLRERDGMSQALRLIEAGECDAVVVNELREVYRNPRFLWAFVQDCIDNDTRFISISDCIDTEDENWETMMHMACTRHGMAVPETRRRVKRKATHSFARGGMVMKHRFGYRKLSQEEAASGKFGTVGLRIAKIPDLTEILHQMRRHVLNGWSYEKLADWLEDEGVPTGPYSRKGKWTARMVRQLLEDRILSGQRRFRIEISRLIYGTGKHRLEKNKKAPESQEYPELAHFSPEEHEELLAEIARRAQLAREPQRLGRESPLFNVPRSRSYWPGQHARCGICGGLMYRYGEVLKCQNALGKGPMECWNRVLVRNSEIVEKVLPHVIAYLDRVPKFRKIVIENAWSEYQRLHNRSNRDGSSLDSQIRELAQQASHITKAIALGGNLKSLVEELTRLNGEIEKLKAERDSLTQKSTSSGAYESADELAQNLDSVLRWLAKTSRDFAEVLRCLIPEFVVFPVQALDCPQIRPGGRFTISAAAWADAGVELPQVEVTVSLFEPPVHVLNLQRCLEAKQADPSASLKTIGTRLGICYMTVKRAFGYQRLMESAGLTEPFRVITECPKEASRWGPRKSSKPTLPDGEDS